MKEIYENKKGYGGTTEDWKNDVREPDRVLKEIFTELVKKGYNPSEVSNELHSSLVCFYAEHSIFQGIEDRKKERNEK